MQVGTQTVKSVVIAVIYTYQRPPRLILLLIFKLRSLMFCQDGSSWAALAGLRKKDAACYRDFCCKGLRCKSSSSMSAAFVPRFTEFRKHRSSLYLLQGIAERKTVRYRLFRDMCTLHQPQAGLDPETSGFDQRHNLL